MECDPCRASGGFDVSDCCSVSLAVRLDLFEWLAVAAGWGWGSREFNRGVEARLGNCGSVVHCLGELQRL